MSNPKKNSLKHSSLGRLEFTPEDLRWATPEIVANYRARRLRCKVIADLGCGIGFQTFAFAKVCGKVYAVDDDEKKIERAEHNAEVLGLKNIVFIQGDILDEEVAAKVKDAEIIFCDPERLPEESKRTILTIKPNIQELVEMYSSITPNMAIEFPPQIRDIPFDCEKEYISVEGKLNRLVLYFGRLKESERSAVILPQGEVLRSDTKAKLYRSKELGKYLYEADPAAAKAGLAAELSSLTKTLLFIQEKATFFMTSDKPVKSRFFSHSFEVLGRSAFEEQKIINLLKSLGIGKVILRFRVPPKDYWGVRLRYESQLSGGKKAALFKFGEEVLRGRASGTAKAAVVGKEVF